MKVLAVGCHPDDLEICCGGTLARMAAEGHEVYMCHVCSGNMGHEVIAPGELGKIREKEAENAGAVLGAKRVYNVDAGDCMVFSHDMDVRREMVRIIREVQPDLIITHNPQDYMEDHNQTARLVFETSFTASVGHMFPEYPTCAVAPIYYMDTDGGMEFEPELYVDITDYLDRKVEACRQHSSQLEWLAAHDGIDFAEETVAISRFRGLQCGVQYAEGFRTCKAHLRQTTRRLLP